MTTLNFYIGVSDAYDAYFLPLGAGSLDDRLCGSRK